MLYEVITRVARLLEAFRRMPPVHREALEDVLLRVSEMVCELPELAELDVVGRLAPEQAAALAGAEIDYRTHENIPGDARNNFV